MQRGACCLHSEDIFLPPRSVTGRPMYDMYTHPLTKWAPRVSKLFCPVQLQGKMGQDDIQQIFHVSRKIKDSSVFFCQMHYCRFIPNFLFHVYTLISYQVSYYSCEVGLNKCYIIDALSCSVVVLSSSQASISGHCIPLLPEDLALLEKPWSCSQQSMAGVVCLRKDSGKIAFLDGGLYSSSASSPWEKTGDDQSILKLRSDLELDHTHLLSRRKP